jgi:multidrug efflux pump subunit AcrA (membrane-fusion protein)
MKRTTVFLISLMAMSLLILSGCREEVVGVYVGLVEQKPFEAYVYANGVMEAQNIENIYEENGVRIENILVNEGDMVTIGERLYVFAGNRNRLSPIDGVVTGLNVRKGMVASINEPTVVIMSVNDLRVKANIRQEDITKVQIGQEVRIRVDGFSDDTKLSGRLEKLSNVAKSDGDQVFIEALIKIEGHTPQFLRPGMTVNCDIIMSKKDDAMVIPLDSMKDLGGEKYVFVVKNDGRLEERKVILGAYSGFEVEVLSGIQAGNRVVRAPMPYFRTGLLVNVLGS